ncbi:thiol-disulfide oxidoreductase DCC family protein [Haliangium sp.]|uniref:thiol-disulfide oxidoreductase DCC family protein n=1 Tax=Haliangium sp. TaxID=2663208 RepID=UPI003D0B0FD3
MSDPGAQTVAAEAAEFGATPAPGATAEPTADLDPIPPRLILYDGVCGLCDRAVQFFVRVDRDRAFRYAPLQGETTAALRAHHPEIPRDLDTVVFLEDGTVHLRSRAFVRAARHLPWPWRLVSWLWIVPRPLADLGYRFIARIRYRVFGRHESCRLPAPEERALFLP